MKASNNTTLLRNVRAVLPERIIEKASVLIEDGRIARLTTPDSTHSPPDRELNLEGLTLFPGFIDVHIHGAVGVDMMQASADDIVRVSEFLVTQGVTAWLPTLVPAPEDDYRSAVVAIDELVSQQSVSQLPQARALGVHYEGPFVNASQCGALRTDYFRSYPKVSDLESLPIPKHERAVRMITLAPEIAGGVELVSELHSRGWVISIGHTRADVKVLNEAATAGARHMTHFMNAMAPMHHRSPGPVAWGLSRDDVTCDMIADGVHLDPFMLQLVLRLKGANHLTLISDAIAAAGLGDGEYEIWGEKISVQKGRTRNERGSIAGSVITMIDAVRTMLSLGASETDVSKMASTNPARLLGLDQECGSIEEGKRADVVALDKDHNPAVTIVGGLVVPLSDKL